MKIRIKGDSVRFRLTKTEVETFCKEGRYSEQTNFDSAIFNYVIETKEGIDSLEAEFQNNTITLFLSKEEAEKWMYETRVGYENQMTLKSGKKLHLLLEKDFICLDETIEDQSDNYPNPKNLG
ncbi:hypothetical protein DKG77_01315 [Flagellimonas aquimarina]|jgi:hypothetical protein|uniref:Uncharacterized protein n=1 Tax=Flagellimonas aquimarina TaxID=2201895 RepID=A0A316L3J6_9FLAO|nr:hypothetical protein [Allomuricauda koreensis]PWL39505.1 hypothetical protein DKG77_01315 [Allomuricauda koreensis]